MFGLSQTKRNKFLEDDFNDLIWLPGTNFCQFKRFGHTTIGFTTCGGWGSSDDPHVNDNCYTFNTKSGEWQLSQNQYLIK